MTALGTRGLAAVAATVAALLPADGSVWEPNGVKM